MNTSKVITDRYVFDAYPFAGGGGSDSRGSLSARSNGLTRSGGARLAEGHCSLATSSNVPGHAHCRPLRASGNDVAPGLHNTTEGNALRFRWNGSYGYRTLPGTNVIHVGARHYCPPLRRWLQRDPVDLAGGDPNLYRYCTSNPISGRDASGTGDEWQDLLETVRITNKQVAQGILSECLGFAKVVQATIRASRRKGSFFDWGANFVKALDWLKLIFVGPGVQFDAEKSYWDPGTKGGSGFWYRRKLGGEHDPRHFVMSAYIAVSLGQDVAAWLGNQNEGGKTAGQCTGDSLGDQFANMYGREFGSLAVSGFFRDEDHTYDWIVQHMCKGLTGHCGAK
jgi:RHS repeat-associated protein